jgi:hypothetical protein
MYFEYFSSLSRGTEDNNMQDEIKQYQCRHIFAEGRRCASPCLRHEEFCYYHHTTRRPVANPRQRRSRGSTFDLPHPEDRSSIQSSIGEVLRRIASNEIDPKRAGLLLYGLQIASANLPRPARSTGRSSYNGRGRYSGRNRWEEEDVPETTLVQEIVLDPELGTIAPRTEVVEEEEEEKLTVVGQLLRDIKLHEEEEHHQKAEAAKLESVALTAQPPALEHSGEAPHNPNAILPILQAHEDPKQHGESPKQVNKARNGPKNIEPSVQCSHITKQSPPSERKSPKKLTHGARIAIVRGFREYPDRVFRETRSVEGWRKARAK